MINGTVRVGSRILSSQMRASRSLLGRALWERWGGRGGRVRRPLPTVNSPPPLLFVTRGREGGAVSFVWPDNWHERRKQLTGRSTADRPCHCSSVLNANAHTPILRPFPSHVISAIAAALLKMLHRHYFTATASKKF